jgi:hypothetical protein
MKMKLTFAVLALALVSAQVSAGVIYTETFDGDGAGSINGKVTATGGGIWVANPIVTDDGVNDDINQGSAVLSFTPELNKVYTLSMDIYQTGIANIGLGFTTGAPANAGNPDGLDRFVGSFATGVAWGQFNGPAFRAWEGLKAVNRLANITYDVDYFNLSHTITVVIDTTGNGSSFTAEFFVDGVSQNESGGPDIIDAVGVADISHVGFSRIDGDPVTVDNFSLSVVPEPCTLALLAAGMVGAGLRKKR